MSVRLVFALFPLLFLGAAVHAQTPCSDCLNAADAETRKCLGNAISADDKVACLEERDAQAKVCRNREWQVEREESVMSKAQPSPRRPG